MILDELRKTANGLQGRCAPVPVDIAGLGEVGHMTREHGLYINSALRRPLNALVRDHDRYEKAAREASGGMFGAELAGIARQMSDSVDVVRSIKNMRGALTSWAGIVAAQAAGKNFVSPFSKPTAVTTFNAWQCDFRIAGFPAAGSYAAIPGGGTFNGTSTGAAQTVVNALGVSDHLYLTNAGFALAQSVASNTSIVMVVDLLVAAGNINAATATSQTINTTALPRWTTGEGLCMTLEVTTNLVGGTAPTIALTYTDQAGNTANSTGAIAITTGAQSPRLLPIQDGPMIRLASPDNGVRQVESCIITGTITSGALAAVIYKPIRAMCTLSGLPTERTTPAQAGGMSRLTETAGGQLPCLTTFRYATNNVGTALIGFLEFAWG